MRRSYLIFAGVILVVAVVVCWQSVTMVVWTPIGPGPGFFTGILGAIMGLLAVGVAWDHRKVSVVSTVASVASADAMIPDAAAPQTVAADVPPVAAHDGRERTPARLFGRLRAVPKAMLVAGVLVLLPFVLEPLGYRITVLLLLVYVIWFVERRRLLSSVLIAAAVSVLTYYLFSDLLAVPLPRGFLGV